MDYSFGEAKLFSYKQEYLTSIPSNITPWTDSLPCVMKTSVGSSWSCSLKVMTTNCLLSSKGLIMIHKVLVVLTNSIWPLSPKLCNLILICVI